jgi:hypothetical protein
MNQQLSERLQHIPQRLTTIQQFIRFIANQRQRSRVIRIPNPRITKTPRRIP